MNTLIVEGKRPKFNPWLIVKYALKFWPVSLTALGVLACYGVGALAHALDYQGLLWIPFIIGTLAAAAGVLAMVLHATWAVYEWIDLGGWDDLKDAVDNKVKNYGRLEDE